MAEGAVVRVFIFTTMRYHATLKITPKLTPKTIKPK